MSVQLSTQQRDLVKKMLRKVPEVTIWFWIIKVLATTVGETAADFLGVNLNLGLTITTLIMSGFLMVALFFQFRARRYVPGVYWVSIVLISVVGTLITDNLTDNLGISLTTTTIVFSVALLATFAFWYRSEGTLSIHSIYTSKREAFYWLAILFTFALGTASGDLVAEKLGLGYPLSAVVFASMIGGIALAYFYFRLNGILAFWMVYILTRPLGASVGDLLSQPRADGGLGLGTTVTSAIFLLAILAVVTYLSRSKVDVEEVAEAHLLADSGDLVFAAREVLGVGEEILAAGVFYLQDANDASLVSSVATHPGEGAAGEGQTLTLPSDDRRGSTPVLVAVTERAIHVMDWDGAGHSELELLEFSRSSTTVQITRFGEHRHVNLADAPSDRRMGLIGSTAPHDPSASGDKLVVHLLAGSY